MDTKISFPYRKILIVGCGGAGKSTLAIALGRKFVLPVIHLDRLWWLPDWKTKREDEFDAELQNELIKPSWIIEGNFVRTFGKRLGYADLCIFLDYPPELCLKSVYERAEKYRGTSRPDMTEGCLEQVDPEFEQWIRTFGQNVRPDMLKLLENAQVPYEIFRSREQTEEWMNRFKTE